MKRRLRKKKRVGEFRELGFPIRFRLADGLSEDESETLVVQWILEAIEANALAFGGGGSIREWEGFVTLARCGSATEEHRRVVAAWLSNEPGVVRHEIGPLVDAWYGDVDSWFALEGQQPTTA